MVTTTKQVRLEVWLHNHNPRPAPAPSTNHEPALHDAGVDYCMGARTARPGVTPSTGCPFEITATPLTSTY